MDDREKTGTADQATAKQPCWQEARFRVPVLIPGSLDGIAVGYRQLRRTVPLETQALETPEGRLIIPRLEADVRTHI